MVGAMGMLVTAARGFSLYLQGLDACLYRRSTPSPSRFASHLSPCPGERNSSFGVAPAQRPTSEIG